MHGVSKPNRRRRRSLAETGLLVLIGVTAFVLASAAHDKDIGQKWVTALFGTLVPFCLVTFLRRKTLRWSYWLSLTICLVVHCGVTVLVFQYILAGFDRFSPLMWYPAMLIEVFVLV